MRQSIEKQLTAAQAAIDGVLVDPLARRCRRSLAWECAQPLATLPVTGVADANQA